MKSQPLFHAHAVRAECKRQLQCLLGNPLGYIFILVFVLAIDACLFIPDEFYARNIADLWWLKEVMPWMLAVVLPALCMGSWSTERELGTEDQLLTLPMRVSDVLIGKWCGLALYFSLALVFSLSNILVLSYLGAPDIGLIIAQYQGWWLTGLIFAAISLWASTMVSIPAVAFVAGVALCSLLAWILTASNWWFQPFDRGVIALPRYVLAALLIAVPLALAGFTLSARRWQQSQHQWFLHVGGVAFFTALTVFNGVIVLDRQAIDIDVTEENSSSLSAASLEVLQKVERPVTITAFVSRDLPQEVALKGEQLLNKLQAMDRSQGSRIEVVVRRPTDALDAIGQEAADHFNVNPRPVIVETITGRDQRDIFLGAVVRSGAATQTIEYFDPGLSVEYELVRAVRAVSDQDKKTLGIVQTDMNVMGGYDFETRQMQQPWAIVEEWEKQYDVREINLDEAVDEEIDVLVAVQPSRLSQDHIVRLHDAIWQGVPTVILEDPLPLFSGPMMGTSQPKQAPGQGGMGGPGGPPVNGDIIPLVKGLGLDLRPSAVAWSDYNPSHEFRRLWPRDLVWAMREFDSIGESVMTTGIDSLLLPWPGSFRRANDGGDNLRITALVSPTAQAAHGTTDFSEHFSRSMFGMQKTDPQRFVPSFGSPDMMAAHITGTMERAFAALSVALSLAMVAAVSCSSPTAISPKKQL